MKRNLYSLLSGVGALLLMSAPSLANSAAAANVTAQDLNQNTANFIGKQVAFSGRVDRVLGNGAYIVSDSDNTTSPSSKILVFTTNAKASGSAGTQKNGIQQPGVAAFSEGDRIQLTGRADQFSISHETDQFSPKSDSETIAESSMTMPVVVVQSGKIWRAN
jgi:hypothetical protein